MDLTNQIQYGALPPGFSITLPPQGYISITGPNNSGKSSTLQFIFKELYAKDATPFDKESNVIIFTDRIHVMPDTQPSSESLATYTYSVWSHTNSMILALDQGKLNTNRLPKLLLNHGSFLPQLLELNQMLERLQLPTFELKNNQTLFFEDIAVHFQGSGLRSLFYILSALTDPKLHCILIDEPELALEPRLQRVLRDLLMEKAKDKLIIVATHSNLFLNRTTIENNYEMSFVDGSLSIRRLDEEKQLYDITFNLLGSSLMDLYFPENYLIVEGTSDQIICEKVQKILSIDKALIKVLSASGIDNIKNTYGSVVNSLRPLVVNSSPYAKRIVALVDASDTSSNNYLEISKTLKERLFTLTDESLEEYIPEQLYKQAGRDKVVDLSRIVELRNDHTKLGQYKKVISNDVASILDSTNISGLQIIVDALQSAAKT